MTELKKKEQMIWLLQEDWQDIIVNKIGREPWITVYLSKENESEGVTFFSALIPNSKVDKVLNDKSWDLLIGRGMPGCTTYGGEREETRYHRFGNDDGIEPLVLCREFHGVKPSYVEISEEFRLFHNLYYDAKNNKYVRIDDDGDEEDIIILDDRSVKIKLKQIIQFLAIKEMHLAVYFEICRYSTSTLEELGLQEISSTFRSEKVLYHLFVGTCDFPLSGGYKTFSRLSGKKLIAGVSKDKSGIWPYKKEEKEYADFIIGINENGENVAYNCNPDKLANYFGANSGAPHYLTPVFFRREVLNKYYTNPEKFSVEDGYLRCGGLWGLRMDNNHERYIIVFLGDLGQDLSYKEQLYWKSFNVPSEGGISAVNWKRGFLAQFADPEKTDLLFKCVFESFQSEWLKRFGWYLFKPLSEKDKHFYTTLRIPLTNDQAEFDSQVLALAKILIDSLNEEKIQKHLPTEDPGAKGISKFGAFLKIYGLTDFEPHIKLMRDLYDLRHGVGHRKGKQFEKIAAAFQLAKRDLMVVFEDILKKAMALLQYLDERFLKSKGPTAGIEL